MALQYDCVNFFKKRMCQCVKQYRNWSKTSASGVGKRGGLGVQPPPPFENSIII
jgi:hypothetical protein